MTTTREAPLTLDSLTRPELIFPRLSGLDRGAVLRELATRLAGAGVVDDGASLYRLLEEREELGSTGIGSGVAVPHCKVKGIDGVLMAVGVTAEPVEFDSADGKPVQIFFVVLSPPSQPAAHLRSLAAISHWVQGEGHLGELLTGRDAHEIYAALRVENHGE